MNTLLKSIGCSLLCVSLAGCVEGMAIPGMKSASSTDSGSNDTQRTKNEGALGGALLGAITGYLTGGDAKHALAGAALGAGAGYLIGNEVAKRKQNYKNQEDMIAQESQAISQLLVSTRSMNASLARDIASYREQGRYLQAKMAQSAGQQKKLAAHKQTVEKRYQESKKALDAVDKELQISEQLYTDAKASTTSNNQGSLREWEARISALKAEKVKLQEHSGQLQAMSQTLG